MAQKGSKWTELSSDEHDEEDTKQQKVETKADIMYEDEEGQKYGGRTFQNQQKKAPIQHRSEIEELIDGNRTEEIVLNLVKCHFDATESDIKDSFPDFKFVDVENYNKGSFSLVFDSKSEAKRFVQSTRNLKILDRNFWVKFPTMHQKTNNRGIEDVNNDSLPNQDRRSTKDYDAPKKNRDTYNRRQNGDNVTQQESVGQSTQKQFFRSDEKRGQRPEVVPQSQQYKPEPKKVENDDEGWSTVGINQRPVDLKPKQRYTGGNNQGNKRSYQK